MMTGAGSLAMRITAKRVTMLMGGAIEAEVGIGTDTGKIKQPFKQVSVMSVP